MFSVLAMLALLFLKTYWMPAKYSVKEEQFPSYKNFILVRETWHTGTKWEVIGNENGYYKPDDIKNIHLTGEKLPSAKMGYSVNTFLCIAEYEGTVAHVAFSKPIESYKIMEWHPVYPVVRDSLWPPWMLPSGFMTKKEVKSGFY